VTQSFEYLGLDDVLTPATRLLKDPVPIRDVGLLGAAVVRPQTPVGGRDVSPDVWTKAAALLQSIVNDHALIDGNERLGWFSTAVFFELNAIAISGVANDEVYDLAMAVASCTIPVDAITTRLRQLSREGSG
jgi:death-on-curing protein